MSTETDDKKELIKVTKKVIGYTEAQNTCDGCIYSEEVDGQIDRSWDWICKVSEICHFKINPKGRCNLHQPKKQ